MSASVGGIGRGLSSVARSMAQRRMADKMSEQQIERMQEADRLLLARQKEMAELGHGYRTEEMGAQTEEYLAQMGAKGMAEKESPQERRERREAEYMAGKMDIEGRGFDPETKKGFLDAHDLNYADISRKTALPTMYDITPNLPGGQYKMPPPFSGVDPEITSEAFPSIMFPTLSDGGGIPSIKDIKAANPLERRR